MHEGVRLLYDQKSGVYAGSFNAALVEHITEPGPLRILDVGCADGMLGAELKRRGHVVHGLEISSALAEQARTRLDGVVVGNIEDLAGLHERPDASPQGSDGVSGAVPKGSGAAPELPDNLDVIIFGDVLEHLLEPAAVLRAMKERLSPRGYFVISVPNFGYLTVRLKFLFDTVEYEASGILDDGHIRIFNDRILRRMVRDLGMRIVSWKSTYRPFAERLPFLRGRTQSPLYRILAGMEWCLRHPLRRLLYPQYVVKVVPS